MSADTRVTSLYLTRKPKEARERCVRCKEEKPIDYQGICVDCNLEGA